MSIDRYREKRKFEETPEPPGQAPKPQPPAEKRLAGSPLRFVVQKHDASHLHYDFRLELDGVLKSWAVPKGPSLDSKDKHLAVMVEDHPYDYKDFEGVIPEGNYGAGTVMVWDEGTYHAPGAKGREDSELPLKQGLAKGHISFVLEGEKLKGEFALVRFKRGGENAWLLIKKADEFAGDIDLLERATSVKTGRSMEEISGAAKPNIEKELAEVPQGEMPHRVSPMLATLVDEAFDREGWLFELKWDGYRAIAEVDRGAVYLYSRNKKPFNKRFPEIVEALSKSPRRMVLDGEVVAVDEVGRSSFQLLQGYPWERKGNLVYYIFDILYLDGHDLRGLPLSKRRDLLAGAIPDAPYLKVSDFIEHHGEAFYQAVEEKGLEGIIAKDGASPYREGVRGKEWLKIKVHLRQEAVIGGYTEPRGGRRGFGALVLGVYDDDELVYVGHTGTGFDERMLAEVLKLLEPLEIDESPFKRPPKTNAPVHWVRPEIVCEVKFAEWTKDGLMRQPVFVGLREDKDAREVRRERSARYFGREAPGKKGAAADVEIGGRTLKLTNLDKVFWPEEGYTKGDLIEYYRRIAELILPYLIDRPEALNRHPDGVYGEHFFHKDVSGTVPEWVQTFRLLSEEDKAVTYMLCQDEATLALMANLGCIEINPWSSRIDSLDKPDYLVIDLDPVEVPFESVIETALAVKDVLDSAGILGYPKTSGATGMHIYLPLSAEYNYEAARRFAEVVARFANAKLPGVASVERMPEKRRGRVYLDYLQNVIGKTLAAPYSVRPFPGATVSTPLAWEEVKPGLDPREFTIETIEKRIEAVGDLFSPVLGEGVDLLEALSRLEGL